MEANPDGNPYDSGLIIDDTGTLRLYYRKLLSWIPGSSPQWRSRHSGHRRAQGLQRLALIICHDGMFPGNGARMRLQGRRDHAADRRLHRADPGIWRFTNQANAFQNLMVTANVCMVRVRCKFISWARA